MQGEEAHMGMQCQCPQCGVAFIIPTIEPAGEPSGAAPAHHSNSLDLAPLGDDEPDLEPPAPAADTGGTGLESLAGLDSGGVFSDEGLGDASIEIGGVVDELGETLLHIPCPNGHVLDVPLDMIGARAMCPHCRAEFRLRREKSIEHLREQEIIEARRARFWFKLAIIAAGVVGIVLIVMVLTIALS